MTASNAISSRKARLHSPHASADSSSSTAEDKPERFALSGPSIVLDPKIHAYRRDIADIALAGQLFAPHYARPVMRRCGLQPATVRDKPSDTADAVTQLQPGEEFAVLDVAGGWAWGYRRANHYVGYVPASALAEA